MTMINERVFAEHFEGVELQPSGELFRTANGEELCAQGQFRAHVQLGPVAIEGMIVTVASVMGDGLLGMDYLSAADAWVGTKEGELYMQMNGYTVSCRLRSEGQAVRWLARPSRPTTIGPMSQGMVPCNVEE